MGRSRHTRAPRGLAPLAIGLALTLIHLISIPVDNTSVNPARSFSQAVFAGGVAIEQLWLFILAPLVGAAIAGVAYGPLLSASDVTFSRAGRPGSRRALRGSPPS